MKIIKSMLTLFALTIAFSLINVSASNNLTIDSKNYDNSANIFTVAGTSTYTDVMVSLFDGEDLLSFKTVNSNNGNYSATFNISFSEAKEVTIKVGDIDSTDYALTTLDVEASLVPVRSNKIIDEFGNSLTILNSLKKFELDDELSIDIITDFENMSEEEQELINFVQSKLGIKRKLVGVMNIEVNYSKGTRKLEETKKGYELFLKLNEEDLEHFSKPCAARILDEETMNFEDPQKLVYSSDAEGVVLDLNNIGLYLLYDDISIEYKFLDGTGSQKYNPKKDKNITLKIDADYDKFLNVYVDGNLLDTKYYDSKSGSTIIVLKKEYLGTLKAGNHEIKVDFTDGEANATLNVLDSSNPKTLDSIIKYVFICLVSIVGMAVIILIVNKKNSHKK